jgi:DNA-binding transcriptional regulator YbjK
MMANADGRLARGELRRTLLLDAAVTVVAGHGYAALTHRAAAAEAGVSVASVTYHFPSIGDLREAMFQHAGSRIGLAFRDVIQAASARAEDVPEITGSFSARLVAEQRVDTAAVFEMIIAAGHDPGLRPLVRFFNDRLAELLDPYIGSQPRAHTVAAAIQGLILSSIAQSDADATRELHDAVVDLVCRYRSTPNTDGGTA